MASKKPQTISAAVRRGAAGMPKLPAQFTPPGPDMQPLPPGDSAMDFPPPPPPMAMLPTEPPAPAPSPAPEPPPAFTPTPAVEPPPPAEKPYGFTIGAYADTPYAGMPAAYEKLLGGKGGPKWPVYYDGYPIGGGSKDGSKPRIYKDPTKPSSYFTWKSKEHVDSGGTKYTGVGGELPGGPSGSKYYPVAYTSTLAGRKLGGGRG